MKLKKFKDVAKDTDARRIKIMAAAATISKADTLKDSLQNKNLSNIRV